MARNRSTLQQPDLSTSTKPRATGALPSAADCDPPLPIWGGVECTLNRVGDACFDQAELSGHAQRPEDFSMLAELGLRTLRFGLLWERTEQCGSFSWADGSIVAMQRAGIRPIAGLLHHGSGPKGTDLLDAEFPAKLAAYAGRVAQRYPHLDAYTPVNEPNTTARFSGLYGLWYPHQRSHHAFVRALVNQVKGTVLSMEAIRRERPDAQLVQTDDSGSIRSTQELSSVADLLHARQWLTFDLLAGVVDRTHPMFSYLRQHGIPEDEVLWFSDHPCRADIVGLNYYATSDRHLDHRLWLYPDSLRSSEGPFVDVEAVRVAGCRPVGVERSIREAWERYRTPVALTEVHLGGPQDEQIRWLNAAYSGMQRAQRSGVQCAGLTVWALFGSYFWNELVTRDNGYYEPGPFDVRDGVPVQTALADFARALASGAAPRHAALEQPGWWQRDDRICYPCAVAPDARAA